MPATSYAMGGTWPFGRPACKATPFLFSLNLGGSATFLACVSVHRFLCARLPATAMRCRARRAATLTCAAVWLLVAVETAPTAILAHSGFVNNTTVCFDMTGPAGFSRYLPYGLFVTAVGFLLPLLVMVTCYCLTVRTLCQAGGGAGGAERSILALCLLGALCFLPYHATRVAYLLVRVHQPASCRLLSPVMLCYKIWRPVVSLNCCVNPALYWSCSARQRRMLLARLCSGRVRPAACKALWERRTARRSCRDTTGVRFPRMHQVRSLNEAAKADTPADTGAEETAFTASYGHGNHFIWKIQTSTGW